jgi:hypothetical protein
MRPCLINNGGTFEGKILGRQDWRSRSRTMCRMVKAQGDEDVNVNLKKKKMHRRKNLHAVH